MHGTTLKFHSNLDANWQRESRARSSSHYRPTITFCWNKIRQPSAFSKRSTYFWEGRISDNVRFGSGTDILRTSTDVRFGSKADSSACPSDVRFTPKSGH